MRSSIEFVVFFIAVSLMVIGSRLFFYGSKLWVKLMVRKQSRQVTVTENAPHIPVIQMKEYRELRIKRGH